MKDSHSLSIGDDGAAVPRELQIHRCKVLCAEKSAADKMVGLKKLVDLSKDSSLSVAEATEFSTIFRSNLDDSVETNVKVQSMEGLVELSKRSLLPPIEVSHVLACVVEKADDAVESLRSSVVWCIINLIHYDVVCKGSINLVMSIFKRRALDLSSKCRGGAIHGLAQLAKRSLIPQAEAGRVLEIVVSASADDSEVVRSYGLNGVVHLLEHYAHALPTTSIHNVLACLYRATDDANAKVKYVGVYGLLQAAEKKMISEVDIPKLLPLVIPVTSSSNDTMRANALWCLAHVFKNDLISTLSRMEVSTLFVNHLTDPFDNAKAASLFALVVLTGRNILASEDISKLVLVILNEVDDKDDDMRTYAVSSLANCARHNVVSKEHTDPCLRALLERSEDGSNLIRHQALGGLMFLAKWNGLDEEQTTLLANVFIKFAHLGDDEAAGVQAVEGLNYLIERKIVANDRVESILTVVQECSNDQHADVRANALWCLAHLAKQYDIPKASVAVLLSIFSKKLSDFSDKVKVAAIYGLSKLARRNHIAESDVPGVLSALLPIISIDSIDSSSSSSSAPNDAHDGGSSNSNRYLDDQRCNVLWCIACFIQHEKFPPMEISSTIDILLRAIENFKHPGCRAAIIESLVQLLERGFIQTVELRGSVLTVCMDHAENVNNVVRTNALTGLALCCKLDSYPTTVSTQALTYFLNNAKDPMDAIRVASAYGITQLAKKNLISYASFHAVIAIVLKAADFPTPRERSNALWCLCYLIQNEVLTTVHAPHCLALMKRHVDDVYSKARSAAMNGLYELLKRGLLPATEISHVLPIFIDKTVDSNEFVRTNAIRCLELLSESNLIHHVDSIAGCLLSRVDDSFVEVRGYSLLSLSILAYHNRLSQHYIDQLLAALTRNMSDGGSASPSLVASASVAIATAAPAAAAVATTGSAHVATVGKSGSRSPSPASTSKQQYLSSRDVSKIFSCFGVASLLSLGTVHIDPVTLQRATEGLLTTVDGINSSTNSNVKYISVLGLCLLFNNVNLGSQQDIVAAVLLSLHSQAEQFWSGQKPTVFQKRTLSEQLSRALQSLPVPPASSEPVVVTPKKVSPASSVKSVDDHHIHEDVDLHEILERVRNLPTVGDLESYQSALENHEKVLNVLVGKTMDCPSLVWLYPKKKHKLKEWLNSSNWFHDTMMLVVVCPVTLRAIQCGPDGNGWEVTFPKKWVKRWGPALVFSLQVLKIAVVAGRILGIPLPSIPSASDLGIDATGLFSGGGNSALNGVSKSVEVQLIDQYNNSLAQIGLDDEFSFVSDLVSQGMTGTAVSDQLLTATGAAYLAIQEFLTTGDNATLGDIAHQLTGKMERLYSKETGAVEWVSIEGKDQWLAKQHQRYLETHHRQQQQHTTVELLASSPNAAAVATLSTTAASNHVESSSHPASRSSLSSEPEGMADMTWLRDLLAREVIPASGIEATVKLFREQYIFDEHTWANITIQVFNDDFLVKHGIALAGLRSKLILLHQYLRQGRNTKTVTGENASHRESGASSPFGARSTAPSTTSLASAGSQPDQAANSLYNEFQSIKTELVSSKMVGSQRDISMASEKLRHLEEEVHRLAKKVSSTANLAADVDSILAGRSSAGGLVQGHTLRGSHVGMDGLGAAEEISARVERLEKLFHQLEKQMLLVTQAVISKDEEGGESVEKRINSARAMSVDRALAHAEMHEKKFQHKRRTSWTKKLKTIFKWNEAAP